MVLPNVTAAAKYMQTHQRGEAWLHFLSGERIHLSVALLPTCLHFYVAAYGQKGSH